MPNILELVTPAALTFAAREVPEPVENSLASVLPDREIDGITTRTVRGTRKRFKAQYRSYNAEAPIGSRGGSAVVQEITLPALSEKLPIDEKSIHLLAQGVSDVQIAGLREQIFDDVDNLTVSVRNRVEEARGQFLSTGKITLSENGVTDEADFGLPGTHRATAPTLWGAAGAQPLTNEKAWAKIVRKDSLVRPTRATTSEAVLDVLAKSEQYRVAFWQRDEAFSPTLSLEQVNQVRAANGLPPLNIYDGEVPNAAGTGSQRVLAENLFILTTDTVGETQWGTTAEALELVGSNAVDFAAKDAPGLTVVQYRTQDPVAVWTKVSSVVMPVAGDINGLFIGTVLA